MRIYTGPESKYDFHLWFVGLWGLINNAGVGVFTFTELCPLSEYERIINVNTLGMVHVSKAFLPLVVKAKGRVVNLTSIAGEYIRVNCIVNVFQ